MAYCMRSVHIARRYSGWPASSSTSRGARAVIRLFGDTVAELLAEHPAQGVLQRLVRARDVLPERRVHQRLVVAAPHRVDLRAKPFDHLVVEANGDPRFAGRGADYRAVNRVR